VQKECWGSWNSKNRLTAPWLPPGAMPEMRGVLIHKKFYFSYFCRTGTAQRWFCTARRQVPDFWALGAIVFLVCAVFVKLHFPVR